MVRAFFSALTQTCSTETMTLRSLCYHDGIMRCVMRGPLALERRMILKRAVRLT